MDFVALLATLYNNRYVIAIVAVLGLLGSFYTYHLYASARIDSLVRDNQELSHTIAEQQRQIDTLRVNYESIVKAKDDLFVEVEKIKADQRKEEERIYRENRKKKSLEELATKKTRLVQNAVNKATKRAFECFETISEGGDC
jgi:septal ring factor EnvC (AmiA/AmiB activator)